MTDLTDAMVTALRLVAGLDAALVEIVARSLYVSLTAVTIAGVIGLPRPCREQRLRPCGRRLP